MGTAAEKRALLKKSRLFGGFGGKALDALVPLLNECRFNKGAMVCRKGEPSDCLYVIADGKAEVSVSSKDGKQILLGRMALGDVFGEIGLLDEGPRTADITAKTDMVLYRLSSRDFQAVSGLMGAQEMRTLASYVCFLFRSVTDSLEETVFLDANIRIARKILDLHEKNPPPGGGPFTLSISQENLGRMVGLSREATNKALAHLKEKGLIEREYRRITVPDIGRLGKEAEDGTI